jgi:hypothetical protein
MKGIKLTGKNNPDPEKYEENGEAVHIGAVEKWRELSQRGLTCYDGAENSHERDFISLSQVFSDFSDFSLSFF